MTCIYCGATEEHVAFNREHVVPESFGRFNGALVLHDMVCVGCNSHFGDTIDRALARDSIEGLERYRQGVKSPRDARNFQYGNVKLLAHEAGEFSGAEIRLAAAEGEADLRANIRPSAAIHESGGEGYISFTAAEILSGAWATARVDWRKGVKLFGTDEAVGQMRDALELRGVKLKSYRPLTPPSVVPELAQEFTIPPEVRRAIAKIAFNYLAFRLGAEFACNPAFDTIRRFIRHGEAPAIAPVHIGDDLPFAMAGPPEKRPVVHFVAIDAHSDHRNMLGVVTLFGYFTYTIVLAEDFHGPWPEVPVAHLYNIKTLTASEMEPRKPRWRHQDSHVS
jgi:hypothetical protein